MRSIDGFQPSKKPGRPTPVSAQHQFVPHLANDAAQRLKQVHHATSIQNIPAPQPLPLHLPQRMNFAPPAKPVKAKKPARVYSKRLQFVLNFVQYPIIAAAAIASAYSSTLGQGIIGVYCLAIIAWRISSRPTFTAALLLLASIPLFQVLKQTGISEKAAIYAFELLVVGTLQAIVEQLIHDYRNETT